MSAPVECPGIERWQAMLQDELPPEEWDRCERHLESCPRCQERLDHAEAFTEALRASARRVGDPTLLPADPAWSSFLERLQGVRSPVQARPGEPADLYFLRPSDRPGVLGLLGDYEVLEVIGQGGMGVVLKAFEPALNRFVAIKVMAAAVAGSATARLRFTREARAAAAVCHDHVVTVHGVHEADGLPYLVMQYVAGESLQERLDRTGPLEVEEAVRIGYQTAAGLAAAHAQGLIHRDVKPANLLLENGVARVKITDFGLARMADDAGLTRDGVVAGTPEYMAPEQARGEPVDHRADLYSLGAVLYACCTGRPPFRGATALAVLRRVSDEQPAPVRARNPEVPAWLEALIARLLAKAPDERFQTAAEVAVLLEGYLAHLRQPATIRAPELPPHPAGDRGGTLGAGWKAGAWWFRRALAPAALVLVGALGAAAALWLAGAAAPAPDSHTYEQSFKGGPVCPPGFKLFGPGADEHVRFQPDGLRITLPAGSNSDGGATGVRSLFGAQGDFEVTVNFEVRAESPPADPGRMARFTMELTLGGPGDTAASISRRVGEKQGADFQPWMRLWNEAGQKTENKSKSVATTARSGRLRIARVGPTVSYYAAEGHDGEFILLQKYPVGNEDVKEVVLAATTEDPQASLDVLFSDLHVRAQALPGLAEAAPSDAARAAAKRGWWAAAGIIGLLLAAGLLGGWLLARRNRRARPAPVSGSAVKPAPAAAPIAFPCPRCGHGLKVKAELAGKKGKCPKCGELVLVPQPPADAPAPAGKGSRSRQLKMVALALGLPLLAVLLIVGGKRLWHHQPQQALPQGTSFVGVNLGAEPVPGVDESGFSYQENENGEPFRWTDGDGKLEIPVNKAAPPQALVINLRAYRRPGAHSAALEVVANGRDLFKDRIHLGSWEQTFDLRGIDLGNRLVLELKSDTFNPAGTPSIFDRKAPSDDNRTLGVQVRGVKLLPRATEVRDLATPGRSIAIREDGSATGQTPQTLMRLITAQAIACQAAEPKGAGAPAWPQVLADLSVATLAFAMPPQGLRGAALSGDGKTLVTGGWDGSVTVWDAAAGRKRMHLAARVGGLRRIGLRTNLVQPMPADGVLLTLAVSPDGATFATATSDGVVRVWDAATGQRRAELRGPAGLVMALAYAPDGRTLAAAGVDPRQHGALTLWDVATGKERGPVLPLLLSPRALAYAPDGKSVAVAGASWQAQILGIDVPGGVNRATTPVHQSYARGVAFAPDGQRLAVSYSNAGVVEVYQLPDNGELCRQWCHLQTPQGKNVGRLEFAPDGRRLVVAGNEGSAFVWDASDPKAPALTRLTGHEGPVRFAAFLPDGRTVLTADDATIRFWSLGDPAPLPAAPAVTAAPPTTAGRRTWAFAGLLALVPLLALGLVAVLLLRRRGRKAAAAPAVQ